MPTVVQIQKQKITCPICNSNNIIKKGVRKNKHKTIQRYQCKQCSKIFTVQDIKHKTYPLKIILKAISNYNLGHTLEKTSEIVNKRYKLQITSPTILTWLNQYKTICTFAKLRKQSIKNYSPKSIINKKTLNHIQPYTFKHHKAKLDIAVKENPQFTKLKEYIEKINTKEFPHHIFTYNKNNNVNEQRASQIKFNHLKINQKQNHSTQLAKLALNLANKIIYF